MSKEAEGRRSNAELKQSEIPRIGNRFIGKLKVYSFKLLTAKN